MDTTITRTGDIEALAESWQRALRAQGRSPSTQAVYRASVEQLTAHLEQMGMPLIVENGPGDDRRSPCGDDRADFCRPDLYRAGG